MKKLFLSIMMLCLSVNPIFGMEENEEQQGAPCRACKQLEGEEASDASEETSVAELALLAIARYVRPENSHLVRSIVCAWLEQYPGGTYRGFLDEYARTFPAQVLPAIGVGFELIRLLTQSSMLINEMLRYDFCGGFLDVLHDVCNFRDVQYPRRLIFVLNSNRNYYLQYCMDDSSSPAVIVGAHRYASRRLNGEKPLPDIDHFNNERSRVDQARQPVLLEIVIWHPEHQSENFCANKVKLLEAVHNAQQPHHTVAVLLVNGDTRHIIIAYRNIVAVIPSIVVPAGTSDEECQQIAQDAIARAINQQPVFRTILEAVQYLEGSDS